MRYAVWTLLLTLLLLQGCSVMPTTQTPTQHQSLAGTWEFLPNDSPDLPTARVWQRIRVPANWYRAGYDHHGYAWYRLKFTAAATLDTVSSLHFTGVDYFADVWLNGQKLGAHEGYFQPFAFDVSPYLHNGQNTLLVRVNSPLETSADFSLHKRLIKGIFAHHDTRPGGAWSARGQEKNTGGIWGEVYLQQSPQVQLAMQNIQVQAVKGLEQWQVNLDLTVLGKLPADAQLHWKLTEQSTSTSSPNAASWQGLLPPQGKSAFTVSNPKLWYPQGYGTPQLYTLSISAVQQGKVLDTLERSIGFRKVEKSAQGIWRINNQRLLLRGTNYIANQWLADMQPADFQRDIQLMQAANINTVRVHAHITAPAFYRLCDEKGLLVWQDFPLQWGYQDTPEFQQQAVAQVGDMIRQFGQHPSIIQWTLHNEPPWNADWMKWKYPDYNPRQNQQLDDALYQTAKALDRSRPITAISSTKEHPWLGWYSGNWLDYARPTRLNTVAEYGAQALPDSNTLSRILGEETTELPQSQSEWATWAYHNFQRKETLEIAKVAQGKTLAQFIRNTQTYQAQLIQLAAESYRRQTYQPVGALFQFMFVEDWESMNWGVVDFWRKPKPAYQALQRAYQPVLPSLAWEKIQYAPNEPIKIGLWALNDTRNTYPHARYRIALFQGKQKRDTQSWQCNLSPDMHQHLRDYLVPVSEPGAYRLEATILDAQGNTISRNEYRFTVQSQQ